MTRYAITDSCSWWAVFFFFFLSWTWNSYDLKIGEKEIWKIGIWIEFSVWAKNMNIFVSHVNSHQKVTSAEKKIFIVRWISSVQFSGSVVSDSLRRPHESQHARPPHPSPTPRVYSNSLPLSWWCHPTILASVVPFSSAFNQDSHRQIFSSVIRVHSLSKSSYHI